MSALRITLLLSLVGGVSAQAILRVGPTQTYQTIQSALAAANHGDRILIDAGTYQESPIVTKGVTLAAASATLPSIAGTVTIDQVPPHTHATVVGLGFASWQFSVWQNGAFVVRGGSRAVIHLCRYTMNWEPVSRYGYNIFSLPFLDAVDSDVALVDCSIVPASGIACAGNPAIEAVRSRIAVDNLRGEAFGSNGELASSPAYVTFYSSPSGSPPPVIRATDSHLTITNTNLVGGAGYQNYAPAPSLAISGGSLVLGGTSQITGGSAAAGYAVPGAPAVSCTGTLVHDRVTLAGGAGQPPGSAVVGTTPRAAAVPDLRGPGARVALGASASLIARGRAGDALLWLIDTRWSPVVVPGVVGVVLHAQPLVVLPAVVPPSETATLTLPVPSQAWLVGLTLLAQGVELSPGGGFVASAVTAFTAQ
jgi:hypothetical protein